MAEWNTGNPLASGLRTPHDPCRPGAATQLLSTRLRRQAGRRRGARPGGGARPPFPSIVFAPALMRGTCDVTVAGAHT